MEKGYFGGGSSLKVLSSASMCLTNHARRLRDQSSFDNGFLGSGAAPRPNAESIKTERTAGVSQLQLRNRCSPFLTFKFQTDGKSAWPVELSVGIDVMKYFVRFIGSSRPLPHCGQCGRFIHANCPSCCVSAFF